MKKTIQNKFIDFLLDIHKNKPADFSGVGLIIYDAEKKNKIEYASLKPVDRPPKKMYIDSKEALDYILEISKKNHPLHDGFHFINQEGVIDHVSQMIGVKIHNDINLHNMHGARHASAVLTSLNEGIIMVGIVGYDYKPYLFINGKVIELNK